MAEVKECCKQQENLRPEPSGKPDLELKRCAVCGCRHFELTANPGSLGLRGAQMG